MSRVDYAAGEASVDMELMAGPTVGLDEGRASGVTVGAVVVPAIGLSILVGAEMPGEPHVCAALTAAGARALIAKLDELATMLEGLGLLDEPRGSV